MAQIPLGNFAQPQTTLDRPTGAAQYNPGQLDQAVGNLVDTVNQQANAWHTQLKQQQDAMNRAKASDAALDYEVQQKQITQDLQTKIQTGAVAYADAPKAYSDAMASINPPTVPGLTPDIQLQLDDHVKRTNMQGANLINTTVKIAQEADFKGQFGSVMDKLGKLQNFPGADLEQINARADAYRPLAKQAGLSDAVIDKTIQDFKDKGWTNQATNSILMARDSVPELDALAGQLTNQDGFYVDKLDPDKRNALLGTILSRKEILQNRQDHLQDRRDAAGVRAINQIDQQIATGVPATPDMWAQWSDSVKGTSSEADFTDRVQDEKDVQAVLRQTPQQQADYIQQKQADLDNNGGSVREQANLKRLQGAVATNMKQLQDAPLLYNQARNDDPVVPIDLTTPSADGSVGDELSRRQQVISAMQSQYGAAVKPNLLLPQELGGLQSVFQQASPANQAKLLGNMARLAGDQTIFNNVMGQLAPKDPVLAYAGLLQQKDAQLVTATHWFKPNDVVKSDDAAATLLQGRKILSDGGKREDGSAFPLPKSADFAQAFNDGFGDLFRDRPQAAQTAMAAVKAYYVGKAAQDGDVAGDQSSMSDARLKEAVSAVLGTVANPNGNGEVLAPWGMPEDTFDNASERAFSKAIDKSGLPSSVKDHWTSFGLQQAGDGKYYVTKGRTFLQDSKGQPVIVDINDGLDPKEQ